ncbi:MAG: SlyX family protein [Wenzhouxiangellaceae bacterium]
MQERIDELEIRVAHQDDTLMQLNDVIIRQQRQIDRLMVRYEQLSDQLSTLHSSLQRKPEDEVPPHY